MTTKRLFPIFMMALALLFTMCDEDGGDDVAPYVGKWETATFEMAGANAKMVFDFTEFAFETEVFVVAGPLEIPTLGVKGTVEPKGTDVLHIKITDLGTPTASGYNWVNAEASPDEFAAIYNEFVADFMPQEFDATYKITGEQMDLIIPAADDTIELYKI